MHSVRHASRTGVAPAATPTAGDRWDGLMTLVRTRLLVATLALPVGVLLRPEATEAAWWVMGWSLLVVGVLSTLFWAGVRVRRGLMVQTYLQLAADVAVVTWLAAMTGGRESQFALFFALIVIAGGLVAQLWGGLVTAAAACAGFVLLPWLATALGQRPLSPSGALLPPPGMLVAFLTTVGVLAGVLGTRVRQARDDLDRTARELDRVRVDNDVILRHLTTGVFTVDATGQVGYMNPAAEQVLGLTTDATCGNALQDAMPERLWPLRELVLDTLRRRTPRARVELMMRTAAGTALPVGISTNLLTHAESLTGVVAVFQDLTEVREMERRARRNQTLAEVGALSAGIAHELRNGLNPISGSVEFLQRELKPEGETAVLMDLITRECSRLNRFVTDLLSYSRERDLALESFDLGDQFAEWCEELRTGTRCPAGVTVRHAPDGPAPVRADREQLRQVWLNLAYNALDAMVKGGTLTVRVHQSEAHAVVAEFSDEGPGIAAEHLSQIGQPFFTTKEGGTGLGLAIAQRIIERHGGTLGFESAPGRGTIARMILPGEAIDAAQAA